VDEVEEYALARFVAMLIQPSIDGWLDCDLLLEDVPGPNSSSLTEI